MSRPKIVVRATGGLRLVSVANETDVVVGFIQKTSSYAVWGALSCSPRLPVWAWRRYGRRTWDGSGATRREAVAQLERLDATELIELCGLRGPDADGLRRIAGAGLALDVRSEAKLMLAGVFDGPSVREVCGAVEQYAHSILRRRKP